MVVGSMHACWQLAVERFGVLRGAFRIPRGVCARLFCALVGLAALMSGQDVRADQRPDDHAIRPNVTVRIEKLDNVGYKPNRGFVESPHRGARPGFRFVLSPLPPGIEVLKGAGFKWRLRVEETEFDPLGVGVVKGSGGGRGVDALMFFSGTPQGTWRFKANSSSYGLVFEIPTTNQPPWIVLTGGERVMATELSGGNLPPTATDDGVELVLGE